MFAGEHRIITVLYVWRISCEFWRWTKTLLRCDDWDEAFSFRCLQSAGNCENAKRHKQKPCAEVLVIGCFIGGIHNTFWHGLRASIHPPVLSQSIH